MTRRVRQGLDPTDELARARRSLGDGTRRGRNRMATPWLGERPGDALATTGTTSGEAPRGEYIATTASGATIAAAGSGLFAEADTVGFQHGFANVEVPGQVPTAPRKAIYGAGGSVEWTDAHSGGADVSVRVAGVAIPVDVGTVGAVDGRIHFQCRFVAYAGDTIEVVVTPSDASSHTADTKIRLGLLEPLTDREPDVVGGGVYIVGYDYTGAGAPAMWLLASGGDTVTSVPLPAVGWALVQSGCVTDTGAVVIGDSVGRVWRSTVSPPTDASDWTLEHTATGSGSLFGMATDGTKVRVIVDYGSLMLVSDDDGQTWSEVAVAAPDVDSINYTNGVWCRWGRFDGANFETSPDGDSWSAETVTADDNKNGYAATSGSRRAVAFSKAPGSSNLSDGYRSTDSGASWTPLDLGLGDASGDGTEQAHAIGDTLLLVEVPGGANGSIWRDTGAGFAQATWTVGAYGISSFLRSPGVDGASGRIVLPGSYDLLVVSDDDGATWTNLTFGAGGNFELYAAFG